MPWWVLIPVVTMLSGPLTLLVLKWGRRDSRRRQERYEELSQAYRQLARETSSGEPAGERAASREPARGGEGARGGR